MSLYSLVLDCPIKTEKVLGRPTLSFGLLVTMIEFPFKSHYNPISAPRVTVTIFYVNLEEYSSFRESLIHSVVMKRFLAEIRNCKETYNRKGDSTCVSGSFRKGHTERNEGSSLRVGVGDLRSRFKDPPLFRMTEYSIRGTRLLV